MSRTRIAQIGEADIIPSSDGRLTISVPIQIKRCSGRKLVTLPNAEVAQPRTSLQLALVRGHRWLALMESGEVKTMRELAAREGVDNSYVSRMVNLTTLAPDVVATLLDGMLPDNITLLKLAADPPVLWDKQRRRIKETLGKPKSANKQL